MAKNSAIDKNLLVKFNNEFKNDINLQNAIRQYAKKYNLLLPKNLRYFPSIDCVYVYLHDKPVLIISLPPVSNYIVDETEYTDKYLKQTETIAV